MSTPQGNDVSNTSPPPQPQPQPQPQQQAPQWTQPPPQQHDQTSAGLADLQRQISALPETIVNSLREALTPAQQPPAQPSPPQQQQQQQSNNNGGNGATSSSPPPPNDPATPGKRKTFAEWWVKV